MYLAAFGLQKEAFSLGPDPSVLYMTANHREALAGLTFAILGEKGFVLLIGDAGTGKTTVLSRVLNQLPVGRVRASMIVNPTLKTDEFLEFALLNFGITEVPASKPLRLLALQRFLASAQERGEICVLVVDEAHKLSLEILEEIRLLGNFENHGRKLLQIVLSGQNELGQLLGREDLRQLKQRISVRLKIEELKSAEVDEYIAYRWFKASGQPTHPFTADAVAAIAKWSKGIPRVVNSICDNALLMALAEEVTVVSGRQILEVCKDLDLLTPETGRKNGTGPVPEPQIPAAAPVVLVPPIPALAPERGELRTLERYGELAARPSLLMRCAAKIGLVRLPATSQSQN